MIQRLVSAALRYQVLVLLGFFLLVAGGIAAYRALPIEAYPNPVPPLVEVIAQPPGWSAEETERYVTIPLEVGLSGMPGLKIIRSQSLFQLSDVKCYFVWGTDYWAGRQEVINRLQFIQLPPAVTQAGGATISPWNAIGEVFRYTLRGKGYTLKELKAVEDFTMERQWRQVPGVIDVTSYGGETKQYHVKVDPYKLQGQGVTLTQVIQAIQNANLNVGGDRLPIGEQSYDIRGIGLIQDVHDIEDISVAEGTQIQAGVTAPAKLGTPVRVKDIATVELGHAPRLGMVGRDDEADVVQGIVLMRYGGETQSTLEGVHERLDFIRRSNLLPAGVEVVPYYDRGALTKITTHTVIENLLVGMLLVVVVQLLFLGSPKAAFITAVNLPLALFAAFIGIVGTGQSANLISVGAVDFGIISDSTVIMMENIERRLGERGAASLVERIRNASAEVGGPMFISTLIIAVAFLPLFTLTGVAGAIFSPMARTYAYAIGGAILLALTLTPVLSARMLGSKLGHAEQENALMRFLHKIYNPFFDAALRRPKRAVLLRCIPIFLCIGLFPLLGRDFMPKLEEGNLWIRATLPMSISLDQSAKYVGRMRNILRGCDPEEKQCTADKQRHPEVVNVVSQLGRPDDGTDVTGFFNIELFAPLKPFDEWPRGLTKEKLTDELSHDLQTAFPGVVFNFSQYIRDNVEEATAGIKGENSVKVIGPDLEENERVAEEIVDVMKGVPGVTDLGLFRSLGQPNIKITPDRKACARYGLNTGDVDAVVTSAVGSNAITQVYEGEKFFDLVVRWKEEYRKSVEAIREITIASADGNYIPLGQIAKIEEVQGPATIYRENGRRYAPVKFSVRGRDLASTIAEAQQAIHDKIKLPYNMTLAWAGEINELKDVEARLWFIIPLTILLIGFLVYVAAGNWLDTAIILIDIPVACTGGVIALLVTGTHFSVSAAMGFVSVFGIAVQDALLMVTYFQQLHRGGMSVEEAAREAAEKRFRPVLMTTFTAMVGLLPAALSTGIGSQTQKPLALVVIGGSIELAVLTRLLQPPMRVIAYRWLEQYRAWRGRSAPAT